jgi:SulP family sulfate permease
MAEASPANSPNQSRRQSRENHDNLVSPISPVSPLNETHSILSHLLKKDNTHERQPLIKRHKSKDYHSTQNDSSPTSNDPELGDHHDTPPHPLDNQHSYFTNKKASTKEFRFPNFSQLRNKLQNPKNWVDCFTQPISYIPAVILGLLLNLLDAISYGMITFPLNNPIFASFGPDGISMFFVR